MSAEEELLYTVAVYSAGEPQLIGGYRSICVTRGLAGLCETLPSLEPGHYTLFLGTGTRAAPWGTAMVYGPREWQLTCAGGVRAGPGYIIT